MSCDWGVNVMPNQLPKVGDPCFRYWQQTIDTWLKSCRVMGRTEDGEAGLWFLGAQAAATLKISPREFEQCSSPNTIRG